MIFIIISCTSGEQKKVLSNKLDKELKNYESTDFDIKNIENNFIEKTTKHYNDLSKIDKSIVIPYDIISNVFLYPVNETIYEKSYLKSKYYAGYKIKISNNIWILCYLHHFDLQSEEIIWSIYDTKKKQIRSNLVIASWNDNTEKRINDFSGNNISIKSTYKRNFQNGMEEDNHPIEILENFEIDKEYRFKKVE
ncbi:hypothetical protein [uncultured Chryseobacterium sp.]|uniref:hypothetical protein n=1 Tax=uncultured Chryseobacterium sp. TaxID=259322 RepID=UPI0025D52091|nr:hypothetical protein [uncultured Chryseobacterium sp.]